MGALHVYSCSIVGRRMKPFECLTSDQVNCVHKLYHFLRKLKVIGIVYTETTQMRNTGVGYPIRYKLRFSGYDHSMRNKLTPEEYLMQMVIEAEELGLYTQESK